MAEPFIGQIKMFAGNFAPRSYAFCHGQLLQIASHTALFSLLGTTYGGDGQTTFGLPDLRSRAPMHAGTGPGLTPRTIGQKLGNQNETLTVNQIPVHAHNVKMPCSSGGGKSDDPDTKYYAVPGDEENTLFHPTPNSEMGAPIQNPIGTNHPHENMSPYLAVNFIIALQGTYPTRS